MSNQNLTNEHKALMAAVDTVDDTWRPLGLGLVVSAIVVPVTILFVLLAKIGGLVTWGQAGWLVLIAPMITLAVLWLVYGLRVWGISMDMLTVKRS